jgi:hypothetical protein
VPEFFFLFNERLFFAVFDQGGGCRIAHKLNATAGDHQGENQNTKEFFH